MAVCSIQTRIPRASTPVRLCLSIHGSSAEALSLLVSLTPPLTRPPSRLSTTCSCQTRRPPVLHRSSHSPSRSGLLCFSRLFLPHTHSRPRNTVWHESVEVYCPSLDSLLFPRSANSHARVHSPATSVSPTCPGAYRTNVRPTATHLPQPVAPDSNLTSSPSTTATTICSYPRQSM